MATDQIIETGLNYQQGGQSDDIQGAVTACRKKLEHVNNQIRTLGRLSGRGPKLVKDAVGIMTATEQSRENNVYQEFLGDIAHHCGSGMTLLCAAGLGK